MVIAPNIRLPMPTDEQILRHDAVRKQAEKFVSQAFFTPMFKAMRASPFKSEVLSGGRGGEVFQSMFDGVLAERMGKGAGSSLVKAMVQRLDPETSRLMKQLSARGFAVPQATAIPAARRAVPAGDSSGSGVSRVDTRG